MASSCSGLKQSNLCFRVKLGHENFTEIRQYVQNPDNKSKMNVNAYLNLVMVYTFKEIEEDC